MTSFKDHKSVPCNGAKEQGGRGKRWRTRKRMHGRICYKRRGVYSAECLNDIFRAFGENIKKLFAPFGSGYRSHIQSGKFLLISANCCTH